MTSPSHDAPSFSPPAAAGVDFGYGGDPPLQIPHAIVASMVAHCRGDLPIEACGVLAGTAPPRVSSIYPLPNRLASATRYDADPRALIAAVKTMRGRREDMLAIYHSHPCSPAVPSLTDLRTNYYGAMPRAIVSFQDAEPVVRVWRLTDATYEELAFEIV